MADHSLFRRNLSKRKEVDKADPYLTADSIKYFCGMFGRKSNQPKYIDDEEDCVDFLVDFPESFYEDISSVQRIREAEELKTDRKIAQQDALKEAADLHVKQTLDTQVTAIMTKHKYFVKRTCPVKIKFKSTLNHKEHAAYLRGFIKFQIRPPITSHEQREYEEYISLQNRALDEQNCLMNFSQSVSRLQLPEYNSTPAVIDSYLSDHVSHRCKRVLKYPQYYSLESEIPLRPQSGNISLNFEFKHIGHLLSIGRVPWLHIPNPHRLTKFPCDDHVKVNKRPDCDTMFNKKQFLYKCPVSEDPNAIYLAKQNKVSIVLSASTFKKLVDNQDGNFCKNWDIPVKVQSYDDINSSNHRIVYIDKPLVQKEWTPLQKKQLFYKVSAMNSLTKVVSAPKFKMDHPKSSRDLPTAYSDDLFDMSCNIDDHDSFGADYSSKHSNQTKDFELDNYKKFSKKRKNSLNDFSDDLSKTKSKIQIDVMDSSQCSSVTDKEINDINDKIDESRSPSLRRSTRFSNSSSEESFKSPKSKKLLGLATSTPKNTKSPLSQRSDSSLGGMRTRKSSQSSCDILNNILSEQDTFLKPSNSSQTTKTRANLPNSFSQYQDNSLISKDDDIKTPWSETCPTNWKNYTIKECPDNTKINVHYQLFTLENSKAIPGKQSEPIKVLVRHNVHGLTKYRKEKHGKSKAYVLYPKLENQVFFGCEVNTLSEITQQWADLTIRPNTCMFQMRICTESGSLVMAEERTLANVLKEGKQAHIKFDPQSALASLNAIFHSLLRMPSGEYLLHHSQKTKAFIKLMKAFSQVTANTSYNSEFNLHACYDGNMLTQNYSESNIPWMAIDTHVLTPFHLLHSKIPATFPMDNPKVKKKMTKVQRKIRKQKDTKKSLDDLLES